MPRRTRKLLAIDRCIEAFLKRYRENSNTGQTLEGAYYWNEREVQWDLFQQLRGRTVSRSIGSPWWIHAEGTVDRPRYARWAGQRRADIVVINHAKFLSWWKSGRKGKGPAYEAMIEVKIIWSGEGKATRHLITKDLKKIGKCVEDGLTQEANLILLDALGQKNLPYYNSQDIENMLARLGVRPRAASRVRVWHWPDSSEAIGKISRASWHMYTGFV